MFHVRFVYAYVPKLNQITLLAAMNLAIESEHHYIEGVPLNSLILILYDSAKNIKQPINYLWAYSNESAVKDMPAQ